MTFVSIQAISTLEARPARAHHRVVQIMCVEAVPYSLPYRRRPRFASGEIDRADHVLVRIHTDEGVVGVAEAQPRPYTYGETQASIVAAVRTQLSPVLVGVDPSCSELAYQRCRFLAGNHVARGAVDLAIWDLIGKARGLSCRAMLGDGAAEIEVAYMVSFDEPSATAQAAVEAHERWGVSTFKIKVGREPVSDIATCEAVRDALPEAKLYVDANRGWSYEQATRAAAALSALGVVAIEEPVSLYDEPARRRLGQRLPIPVIGDESCITLTDTARSIDSGAVRTVSIKTARTGFTESRRILDHCISRCVPVLVGSQYEAGIGALATAAFAGAFPHTAKRPAELANVFDLADDLLAEPLRITNGRLRLSDAPGVVTAIDEDKLAHYRLEDRAILQAV